MMRDRISASSRSEVVGGSIDRKQINNMSDKHFEKSSSRFVGNKEEVLSVSVGGGNSKQEQRDTGTSSSMLSSKHKCSDGKFQSYQNQCLMINLSACEFL